MDYRFSQTLLKLLTRGLGFSIGLLSIYQLEGNEIPVVEEAIDVNDCHRHSYDLPSQFAHPSSHFHLLIKSRKAD